MIQIFKLTIHLSAIVSVLMIFAGCGSNTGNRKVQHNSIEQLNLATTSKETNSYQSGINVGSFKFDSLPEYFKEQVEGAGCDFSFVQNGDSFMINGLMLINGVFEMLYPKNDEASTNNIMYENESWILIIEATSIDHQEGGATYEGRMILKNKSTKEIITRSIFGACGC